MLYSLCSGCAGSSHGLREVLQRNALRQVAKSQVFEATDELGESAWGLPGLLALVDLQSLRGIRYK